MIPPRLPRRIALGRCLALPADDASASLFERCAREGEDYIRRTDGACVASRWACDRISTAAADEHARLFVLVLPGAEPAGILELLLDHPFPGEVALVLLLLGRCRRGQGLGREIVEALIDRLPRHGYRHLHLGVARGEDGAARFWGALGMWESKASEGVRNFELALRAPGSSP